MFTFGRKPGRYGKALAFVRGVLTGNIGNSTTTTYNIGGVHRKAFLERLSFSARTVPASSGGAVTCIVYKYDASAASAVALTAAFDLEGLTASVTSQVPLLASLTDAQLILDEGDTLRVVVTTDNTMTTQPTDLILSAEVSILE